MAKILKNFHKNTQFSIQFLSLAQKFPEDVSYDFERPNHILYHPGEHCDGPWWPFIIFWFEIFKKFFWILVFEEEWFSTYIFKFYYNLLLLDFEPTFTWFFGPYQIIKKSFQALKFIHSLFENWKRIGWIFKKIVIIKVIVEGILLYTKFDNP